MILVSAVLRPSELGPPVAYYKRSSRLNPKSSIIKDLAKDPASARPGAAQARRASDRIAALVVGVVWAQPYCPPRDREVGPRTRSVALRLEGLLAGLAVVAALAGAAIATGDPCRR